MNTRHRMLFIAVVWMLALVLAVFTPDDFRLIWVVIVSIACLLLLLINYLALKGIRLDPQTGIAKKQQRAEPCRPDLEDRFNYQLLIDLAALLSGNDPTVMQEVRDAAFDFENYTAALRAYDPAGEPSIPQEQFRERWYPNTQADLDLLVDYAGNRPAFCCMNMVNWLADKGYVVSIHRETEYAQFTSLLRGAMEQRGVSIRLEELGLKKDDEASGRLYLFDNLEILGSALQAAGYYLLHLDTGGDFNLAIMQKSEWQQIRQLDWESVKSGLKIEALGTK